MVYELSEEDYQILKRRVADYKPGKSGFIPWPSGGPYRWNACTLPCDMWTGPCCCGATHEEGK